MTTAITTINANDLPTNSRTDINNNFSSLNTNKIETSVLDTDNTLNANSDAKIPSQKAVKSYVDTQGGANASTTVRGVVEEATNAEAVAGTATGGTGARLFLNPSTVAYPIPTVRTYLNGASPATWSKPAGLKYITVEVQAGGGGGGGPSGTTYASGGGGGGYSKKTILAVTLGNTETVTIGAGGTAGSGGTGGTGGSSSFGAHATTTGGIGGTVGSTAVGGAGGTAASGDVNIPGGQGPNVSGANASNLTWSAAGGDAILGKGAGGVSGSTAGTTGGLYGGGGSGGGASSGGGAGAAGIVIVTEYTLT